MPSIEIIIGTAALSFLATNIDEFVVWMIMLAKDTWSEILIGTLLAFIPIVGISLLALVVGMFVRPEWLDLSGFIPILLACWMLFGEALWEKYASQCWTSIKSHSCRQPAIQSKGDTPPELNRQQTRLERKLNRRASFLERHLTSDFSNIIAASFKAYNEQATEGQQSPVVIHFNTADADIFTESQANNDQNVLARTMTFYGPPSMLQTPVEVKIELTPVSNAGPKVETTFAVRSPADSIEPEQSPPRYCRPAIWRAMVLTFTSSSDNISIYGPQFAAQDAVSNAWTIVVFFVLLFVLFGVAVQLYKIKRVSDFLSEYGERIMPWPLIGIGLYILWGSALGILLQSAI